ncbi:hypothetical protein AGABI1DRAFT_45772, partial [Agaricus bisporus var. burnettii JB137-S8]
ALESGGRIGESKRHNQPFKGTIASTESSFPFVTISNADKMIGMPEVNFGIDVSFAGRVKEIGNKW